MPSPPSTTDALLLLVAKSELLPAGRIDAFLESRRADQKFPDGPFKLAQVLVHEGLLTKYQAEQLLTGRWRNFHIGGKYKLLERLGRGGMALVFLCEHRVMRRLVALKILPTAHAEDKELLGRFHREARALSSLHHPNIVGAYDADHADKVHFLVMEYVDGGDIDQVVQKVGPLGWERSANYIRQAALGLQHAHERGLVHRDVKPGNLLVDRSGVVKLLDLGLARIFHEPTDDLTTGRDAKLLLGTVDYLAPEQALNSHDVDIRADIYGLGATFYFMLTGKGLFEDGTVAQKLSWHLHRPPLPISEARPDVPEGLVRVVERMLAKDPDDRYQEPWEVFEALEPWTRSPAAPPDPSELPQLSRAVYELDHYSGARMVAPSPNLAPPIPARRTSTASRSTKILPDAGPDPSASGPGVSSTLRDIPALEEAGLRPGVSSRPRPRRRRVRLVGALATGLATVATCGWWMLVEPVGRRLVASRPVEARRDAPEPDLPADASISLRSGSSELRGFATLREAVRESRPGDRVVVTGSLLVDSVELSDVEGAPHDLTIEGVNPETPGGLVRWQGPRDLSAGRALLEASGLEGFQLRGFLLDGQGRVSELVRLAGRAGGATLEDLEVRRATRAGIALKGWAGESGRPATIRRVRFSTSAEVAAAIAFDADADRPTLATESIRVESCRFVGPFVAALLVAAPVEGLEVEHCRFHRAIDGLRYRKTDLREPIRARLANNTFADLQRGLHFETTPPAASSNLILANNLFVNTARTATLDRVSVGPGRVAARWIWADQTPGSADVPPATWRFRKTFDLAAVPEKATLDIGCDDSFTAWLNGAPLMASPSPHFTQRVFSVDVSKHLRPGRNVLAVEGTNRADRLDLGLGTPAGLFAQVSAVIGGRAAILAKTDETWRCVENAPEGWTLAGFDDRAWAPARPWPEDGTARPWKFAVWDSTVRSQIRPPLEPIAVTSTGNIRDERSWEGYPSLESERVAIREGELPRDPEDDSTFLRPSADGRLATIPPQ